jgi:hypothetical protein
MQTATINDIQIGQEFKTQFFTFNNMATVVRVAQNRFQITYTKMIKSSIIGNPPFPKIVTEFITMSLLEQVTLNNEQRTAPTKHNTFYI